MAPDKIYIQPRTIDDLPRQNIVYTKRLSDTSIEYIRKDALLEWAKTVKADPLIPMNIDKVIAKIESL